MQITAEVLGSRNKNSLSRRTHLIISIMVQSWWSKCWGI